jgi:LAO/AO transport system kinase
VLLTSALEGTGVRETWQNIEAFTAAMKRNGVWNEQRREQLRHLLYTIAKERLEREFYNAASVRAAKENVEQKVLNGTLSPFSGASYLLNAFFVETGSDRSD